MGQQPDDGWSEPFPKGENDGPEVIERYGPGPGEVVLWDTTSNYARIRAMRLEGKTVPEISAALEIPMHTVKQSLTNQIKAESATIDGDEIITILGLEMERLDHLVQAHFWAAKAGDMDSTKAMIAISRERREWLKWAQPEPEAAKDGVTNNILVIGGSEAEFLKGLQTAREYLEAEHGTVEADVVEEGESGADDPD